MNDAPEQAAAPEAAPAPVGAGPEPAAQHEQQQSPIASLTALQRSPEFHADWSGNNGRAAQKEAVERKSALLKTLHGAPETYAAPIPEQLADAMDSSNDIIKETAAGMVPASNPSEYSFKFEGVEAMELQDIAELNELAAETAFSAGASVAYGKSTIEAVDRALAKSDGTPPSVGDLETAMSRQYGDRLPEIQASARATIARMPERSQKWVTSIMERLPASDGAFLLGRLASINRAAGPR